MWSGRLIRNDFWKILNPAHIKTKNRALMIVSNLLLMALAGTALTSILILVLRRPALAVGYTDNPQGRKQHKNPVPPIGGVITFPVLIFLTALAGFDWLAHWYLALAIVVSLAMGAIDDVYFLRSYQKFLIQIGVAFLLVMPGGATISSLGNLLGFGPIDLGLFAVPFSLFCMVLLINAINMIDGMDGLSGGVGLIMLALFGWFAFAAGRGDLLALSLISFGALSGFTLLNMRFPWQKQARIFLGDAGSLSLGCLIGWLAITLYNSPEATIPSMTLGWILAFPVMDAFALFALRLSEKRSPFSADRYHFHHILRDSGLRASISVMIIHGVHILYAGIALCLYSTGGAYEWLYFYVWAGILAIHTVLVFKANTTEKFIHSFFRTE